jgi:predicted  nucleic acid-binding Zn-ribbon protein
MLSFNNPDYNPALMQATISQFESEIADLKNRLEAQESEIQKANSKFEFSVSEQEKLKKGFEAEKKAWADEKASLVTRAEKAEASLAEATAELSGLKRQISQMVSAIFGKLLVQTLNTANLLVMTISIVTSGSPDACEHRPQELKS